MITQAPYGAIQDPHLFLDLLLEVRETGQRREFFYVHSLGHDSSVSRYWILPESYVERVHLSESHSCVFLENIHDQYCERARTPYYSSISLEMVSPYFGQRCNKHYLFLDEDLARDYVRVCQEDVEEVAQRITFLREFREFNRYIDDTYYDFDDRYYDPED